MTRDLTDFEKVYDFLDKLKTKSLIKQTNDAVFKLVDVFTDSGIYDSPGFQESLKKTEDYVGYSCIEFNKDHSRRFALVLAVFIFYHIMDRRVSHAVDNLKTVSRILGHFTDLYILNNEVMETPQVKQALKEFRVGCYYYYNYIKKKAAFTEYQIILFQIFFYEHFNNSFNKTQVQESGQWFTPPSVVKFIIKGTEHIVKKRFPSMTPIFFDFAGGTGHFLIERIIHTAPQYKERIMAVVKQKAELLNQPEDSKITHDMKEAMLDSLIQSTFELAYEKIVKEVMSYEINFISSAISYYLINRLTYTSLLGTWDGNIPTNIVFYCRTANTLGYNKTQPEWLWI